MNGVTTEFLTELQDKLIDANVPFDVVESFVLYYKSGFVPEIRFKNDEIPSDDCFKTLGEACKTLYAKGEPSITVMEVSNILKIPYSRVYAAKERMFELFPGRFSEIYKFVYGGLGIIYTDRDKIDCVYNLVSEYFSEPDGKWKAFERAVELGEECSRERFSAVVEAVGEKLALKVVYEATVNGFLLYPYYTDPVGAIKMLRKRFDGETTAKILINETDYLYLYKDEDYIELPEDRQARLQRIREMLEKYG